MVFNGFECVLMGFSGFMVLCSGCGPVGCCFKIRYLRGVIQWLLEVLRKRFSSGAAFWLFVLPETAGSSFLRSRLAYSRVGRESLAACKTVRGSEVSEKRWMEKGADSAQGTFRVHQEVKRTLMITRSFGG